MMTRNRLIGLLQAFRATGPGHDTGTAQAALNKITDEIMGEIDSLSTHLEDEWAGNHYERCDNLRRCTSVGGTDKCFYPRPWVKPPDDTVHINMLPGHADHLAAGRLKLVKE